MNLQKNNKLSKIKYKCYYLLYKLKNSDLRWIVRIDDNPSKLFEHIKHFYSEYEKYYIVQVLVTNIDQELSTKNFTIFSHNEYVNILHETQYII